MVFFMKNHRYACFYRYIFHCYSIITFIICLYFNYFNWKLEMQIATSFRIRYNKIGRSKRSNFIKFILILLVLQLWYLLFRRKTKELTDGSDSLWRWIQKNLLALSFITKCLFPLNCTIFIQIESAIPKAPQIFIFQKNSYDLLSKHQSSSSKL